MQHIILFTWVPHITHRAINHLVGRLPCPDAIDIIFRKELEVTLRRVLNKCVVKALLGNRNLFKYLCIHNNYLELSFSMEPQESKAYFNLLWNNGDMIFDIAITIYQVQFNPHVLLPPIRYHCFLRATCPYADINLSVLRTRWLIYLVIQGNLRPIPHNFEYIMQERSQIGANNCEDSLPKAYKISSIFGRW